MKIKLDENLPERLVPELAVLATEAVDQWKGCLVVATDHKVRVKRRV